MPANPRLYLDHNATAPLRPEARAALLASLERVGNASSVHAEGRAARKSIEGARQAVAALVGGSAKGVVFTSGATEANVTALSPRWIRLARDVEVTDLLVSAVEHPSVLRGGQFPPERVQRIPVDAEGVVQLDALARMLSLIVDRGGVPLVSVQMANNETGALQPIAEVAGLAIAAGGFVHCDAVQAAGRLPIEIDRLGVDTLAISAHKIGGPQGVGALVQRIGGAHPAPLIVGGGQEGWKRAGTEPVAAIAAFGAAALAAKAEIHFMGDVAARRDSLQAALIAHTPTARILSNDTERLPNTLSLVVPGLSAETAVIAFDLEGIAISSGSACSSGKVAASHVLEAMGLEPKLARAGLRISLSATTTDAEIDRFSAAWGRVVRSVVRTAG